MKNRTLIAILGVFAAACLAALVCVSLFGSITLLARRIADQATSFNVSIFNEPTSTPVVVRPSTPYPTNIPSQVDVEETHSPEPLTSETLLPMIPSSP